MKKKRDIFIDKNIDETRSINTLPQIILLIISVFFQLPTMVSLVIGKSRYASTIGYIFYAMSIVSIIFLIVHFKLYRKNHNTKILFLISILIIAFLKIRTLIIFPNISNICSVFGIGMIISAILKFNKINKLFRLIGSIILLFISLLTLFNSNYVLEAVSTEFSNLLFWVPLALFFAKTAIKNY